MISLSIEDIPSRRRLIGRGIGCASQVWEASEEEKSGVVEAMSGEVLLNLVDVPAETKVMGSIGPNGSTRTVQ